jgi:hypothetical protein
MDALDIPDNVTSTVIDRPAPVDLITNSAASWDRLMGADFSNRWFFAGDSDASSRRAAVIDRLRTNLRQAGFQEVAGEEEAERSLVVGPAERWVFIGDSAGSTESADPDGFVSLSSALSTLGPVVDVLMSDSAAVHFHLHRQGRIADKFGNAAFPFNCFASEEEATPYRGRPELWADLLLSRDSVSALRSAWVQEWRAGEILAQTGRLLGWNPKLLWVGYTFDDEGIPMKYDEFLRYSGVELATFDEYHFKQAG